MLNAEFCIFMVDPFTDFEIAENKKLCHLGVYLCKLIILQQFIVLFNCLFFSFLFFLPPSLRASPVELTLSLGNRKGMYSQ